MLFLFDHPVFGPGVAAFLLRERTHMVQLIGLLYFFFLYFCKCGWTAFCFWPNFMAQCRPKVALLLCGSKSGRHRLHFSRGSLSSFRCVLLLDGDRELGLLRFVLSPAACLSSISRFPILKRRTPHFPSFMAAPFAHGETGRFRAFSEARFFHSIPFPEVTST